MGSSEAQSRAEEREKPKMPFMLPDFEEDVPYVVTSDGVIPADCYEGPESGVEERGVAPVLWRLSAPGYMDATDWTFAQTLQEAREDCLATYDVCPDCGEGAEDGDACANCGTDFNNL